MAKGDRKKGKSELKTTTARLSEKSTRLLSELAMVDGLDSAAEAFEKHFAAQLEHLVIELSRKRLKALEDDASKK